MKKFFYVALMCMVSAVFFSACNKNEPEDGGNKVNYDQMIGSWKLTSYSVLWKNLDDNTTEKELNYTDGYLVIEKRHTDDGDAYFYKENFALDSREEYYGMLEIDTKNNQIYLRAEDGFQRRDNAEIYDFKVSFPADGKMEWNYSWQGTHGNYDVSHTCQRTVKAVFIKK
jgi:hypothetical protein